MLSKEIYESWNAKTDADLKDFLDNVTASKSITFKKSVLLLIEKRRAVDKLQIDEYDQEDKGRCCSCLSWLSREKGLPKPCDCKTMGAFEALCASSTRGCTKVIALVKALIQKLSYWESIKSGTDGLSILGGYMWLLSYTCQHLIDCPNNKFKMQKHLVDIKEKYQELGQAGELFLEMTEGFHQNSDRLRTDALIVLKRLTKRWRFRDDHNPLHVRTETVRIMPRPRKRLGQGLDSTMDMDDEDEVFSVKWSPLTVIVTLPSASHPKVFGRLHPEDRLKIFNKFLQCALDKVEMAAEDLITTNGQVDRMEVGSTEEKFSCRQITMGLVNFSKSKHVPGHLSEKEMQRMIVLLNEFWYSVDVLHENVYLLLRLVQETRDIIRTCYVYTDLFYKWHMPSYDTFIPKSKRKNNATKHRVSNAKDILNKFGNAKKLADTQSIVSLMDFSSSIYQGVVQEIPLVCEKITLRLGTNELEMEEPMGLVSGIVDRRKSVVETRKSFVNQ